MVLFGVVVPHLIHAVTLDLQIEFVETELASPSVTTELDGYRIAFVSDTHNMPANRLLEIRNAIDSWGPNLLLLGGDYSNRGRDFGEVFRILGTTIAPDGILAVEGNHDAGRRYIPAMAEAGIRPLLNEGIHVRDGIFVGGVSDLRFSTQDVSSAIQGANRDDLVILLAHNPITVERHSTSGIDLVLSGHTHGGQMTLFGLWAPALHLPSPTGTIPQWLRAGWGITADGASIYVSRGAGTHLPRMWARPEVTFITLRTAS
jgi:predicted MPP superfamily phosphohydrolase